MPFWLCDVIGDGSEGNQFRPALHDHQQAWRFGCYAGSTGFVIAQAEHVPPFDTDPRIRPMRKAQLAGLGATDDGEADDADALDLALKFTRRFLLRQILGADDFAINLDQRVRDLPAARRGRIRAKLLAYRPGIDFSAVPVDASVREALRFILPLVEASVTLPPPRKAGTFTDNFNGAGGDTNLDAWTPSGGTAWTLASGGTSSHAQVRAVGQLACNTSDATGSLFQCDDQGSANQYVQVLLISTGNPFICNRASDANNYVGFRASGIQKRVAGAFTLIGSAVSIAGSSVVKLESDGANLHTLYDDGVSVTSGTDAHNSSITRQGLNPRSAVITSWIDNFEAGTLAPVGGGLLPQLNHAGLYVGMPH